MSEISNVIAAFSEDQTERLTGVRQGQLRYWDKTGFYRPSYGEENRRLAFSRVYSFKDIVALRVLHVLKNQYGVSLQHLRQVSENLSHFGPDPEKWTGANLYVLNKRVVWHEPGTDMPQQIVNKQYVLPTISLQEVVADTKRDIASHKRDRSADKVGKIEKHKYIGHNAPMLAGTRIPVSAIKNFANAGYSVDQILKEYPDLSREDVNAAIEYRDKPAA